MRVSAKSDYALRAMVELAAASGTLKGAYISVHQQIPLKLLEGVLLELKNAGLVCTQRGPSGGYRLAVPADDIKLADIIRAVDGPLVNIRGLAPEDVEHIQPASAMREVWIAVRASLRVVLEQTTLADVASGALPQPLQDFMRSPGAWIRR